MSGAKRDNDIDNLYVRNAMGVDQIRLPLTLRWNPKEDITVFELAQCISILNSNGGIYEVPNGSYMRHFDVYDPNK